MIIGCFTALPGIMKKSEKFYERNGRTKIDEIALDEEEELFFW